MFEAGDCASALGQLHPSGGRPDSFTSGSIALLSADNPVVNLRSREWQPVDAMESTASRSSLAEPISEMPVCEEDIFLYSRMSAGRATFWVLATLPPSILNVGLLHRCFAVGRY
jgi:hypothetical protein